MHWQWWTTAASSAALVLVLSAGTPAWIAAPVVVVWLAVFPGLLVVWFLKLDDPLLAAVAAVATGAAVWSLASAAAASSGAWHPRTILFVLGSASLAVSVTGAAWSALARRRPR